ncbi:MAG: hypothetical protein K1X87_10395 [Dehalococcoidia bacterium]|nr:hypothetical protein [Dehalococcoidia bacterium]
MTTPISVSSAGRRFARPTNVRWAGWLCLWAGLLGSASGALLLVVPKSVPDDRFSYPLEAGPFIAIQVWFGVHHFGLLAGQYGLWRAGALGRGRWAAAGHQLAFWGMVLLAVTEFVAIEAAESLYPSGRTDILDALYGVATVAIGVGFVVAGAIGVRRGTYADWRRWIPLAIGVYVFVPMFPALVSGFVGARLGIMGWMLLYALAGWVLIRDSRPEPGHDSASIA